MIKLQIPGREPMELRYLVSDVNGTLAVDGELIAGVKDSLETLWAAVEIHLVTADTHGKQAIHDQALGTRGVILRGGNEADQKAEYVRKLGAINCVAIGQGANDALMLKEAGLGICVLSQEGAAVETLLAADIVVPDILSAIELLKKPLRIKATLRK